MTWVLIIFFSTAYRNDEPQIAINFSSKERCLQAIEQIRPKSDDAKFLCVEL